MQDTGHVDYEAGTFTPTPERLVFADTVATGFFHSANSKRAVLAKRGHGSPESLADIINRMDTEYNRPSKIRQRGKLEVQDLPHLEQRRDAGPSDLASVRSAKDRGMCISVEPTASVSSEDSSYVPRTLDEGSRPRRVATSVCSQGRCIQRVTVSDHSREDMGGDSESSSSEDRVEGWFSPHERYPTRISRWSTFP